MKKIGPVIFVLLLQSKHNCTQKDIFLVVSILVDFIVKVRPTAILVNGDNLVIQRIHQKIIATISYIAHIDMEMN